jgi:hypothetical protein
LAYDAVTQKKKPMKKRRRKCFSLFPFLSLSLSFSLSFFRCQKKKREREKQKLSSPLETNQLDFFSHFFLSLFTIHTHKRETQLVVPKGTSAFDAVHYSHYSFYFKEFNCMWIYMK